MAIAIYQPKWEYHVTALQIVPHANKGKSD